MSPKRILSNKRQINFEKRIRVLTLYKRYENFQTVADKLGISRQSVFELYNKIKDTSIEDLQREYEGINK